MKKSPGATEYPMGDANPVTVAAPGFSAAETTICHGDATEPTSHSPL